MKKSHLRVIALLLAVMMSLSLAACSKKPAEDGSKTDSIVVDNSGKTNSGGSGSGSQSGAANPNAAYGEFVYVASYQKLNTDDSIQNMNRIICDGERLYTQAWIKTGEKTTEYWDENYEQVTDPEKIEAGEYADSYTYEETVQALCSMKLDGSDFRRLENYEPMALPEGSDGNVYIENMCVDKNGNLWVVEEVYAYHYDEDGSYFDDGNFYYIRCLDSTGAEKSSVDPKAVMGSTDQDYFYVENINTDSEGRLYFTAGGPTVYVLDQDSKLLFKVELSDGNWINGLIRMKDGGIGAVVNSENGSRLCPVDVGAKALGEGVKLPANAYNLIDGGGEYDCYYNTSTGLGGFSAAAGEARELVNWIDSDVDSSNMQTIIPMEDGSILGITGNYRGDRPTYEIVTLTKADPATLPEKEILTFACMWINYDLRSRIIDFNKTSDRYRIRVTDYSSFNTEDDYSAGMTKLATEIISGQVPDILDLNGLPVARYAARGILEDLSPYIDADPDLGPDALVPGVRRALTMNGGIYEATSSFTVTTVIGASRIVGEKMGWAVKDLRAALAQMPAGCTPFNDMDRDSALNNAITMNQANYVNWSTGEVSFDNPEFVELLEFVKTFPKEIDYSAYEDGGWVSDYDKIRSGQIMLTMTNLGDFEEFRRYKQYYGGDITFVGFPTTGDHSGSVASFNESYGISSVCRNKDAAWSFLRTFFLEETQSGDEHYYWGYPTNQKAFDKRVREAMTEQKDEETGEIVASSSYWLDDDTEVELYAMTQEELDQLMELINNMDSRISYDEDIALIITDEAQPFFEGQKTAQDVVSVIQSRAWIYVNEQR